MPFKVKHIFKAPVKAASAVGKTLADTGILGQREGHKFKVVGIPIGKDLVPVVQVATVVAATCIGAPQLATAASISQTAAVAAVSASTNAVLAASCGASDSNILKAAVINPAVLGPIATPIVALATGAEVKTVVVNAIGGAIASGTQNPGVVYTTSVVSGLVSDSDNPLRGALQGIASSVVSDAIHHVVTESKSDSFFDEEVIAKESIAEDVIEDIAESVFAKSADAAETKMAQEQKKTEPLNTTDKQDSLKPSLSLSAADPCQKPKLNGSVSVTTKSLGVTLEDAGRLYSVSNKGIGVGQRHSESTTSQKSLIVGDMFKDDLCLEQKVTITKPTTMASHGLKVGTTIDRQVLQENRYLGGCVATRDVVTQSITGNALAPNIATSFIHEDHLDVNCVKNASQALVGSAAIVVSGGASKVAATIGTIATPFIQQAVGN
jgi:hypothetical protein